jgi:LysM repeat protein
VEHYESLNLRLITSNESDPVPGKSGRQAIYANKFARARTRVFAYTLLTAVIAVPLTVEAGFFSFLTDFFNKVSGNTNYEAAAINSQNIKLLQAALHYDPNPSKGGGDITVVGGSALLPDAGPSGTLANIEERDERPQSDQISIYVVREGDSLSQIAQMFNVSVNTIIWANDIKRGSLISPGQTLIILPISGVQHTVKKGDTLQSIAKKYDGDFEEVLQYNGLLSDAVLAVGDVITVPGGEVAAPSYGSASQIIYGTGGPRYEGYYLRPLVNARRTQGLHGYNGVDLGAPFGTPILAAAAGDVIISRGTGWNGGYGKYIVIRHPNGTQTLYAHNSQNIVYGGESVVQGQVIGYVGSSGRSTGTHVHFEVRGAANPF